MGTENLILCIITAIILDVSALVLIACAYMEKHDGKKRWDKIGGGMNLVEPGITYPLECDEVLIGRHGSVDIRLPDLSVSRYHAIMTVCGGVWTIHALNPKAPVIVNGQRITKAKLKEYDSIQIGIYKLQFQKRRNPNGKNR